MSGEPLLRQWRDDLLRQWRKELLVLEEQAAASAEIAARMTDATALSYAKNSAEIAKERCTTLRRCVTELERAGAETDI